VLNGFDGVYNHCDGVVCVLVVNDLSTVDDALKRRPGRFKYVREPGKPAKSVLERIPGDRWRLVPPGASLDELLAWREDHPSHNGQGGPDVRAAHQAHPQ
jgi:hypothetical protein